MNRKEKLKWGIFLSVLSSNRIRPFLSTNFFNGRHQQQPRQTAENTLAYIDVYTFQHCLLCQSIIIQRHSRAPRSLSGSTNISLTQRQDSNIARLLLPYPLVVYAYWIFGVKELLLISIPRPPQSLKRPHPPLFWRNLRMGLHIYISLSLYGISLLQKNSLDRISVIVVSLCSGRSCCCTRW